jgi:hypothetical protein
MVSPDILISPRLKVQRAYRHVDELASLTQPLSPSLYSVDFKTSGSRPDGEDATSSLTYRPKEPIPETLALVIGDAVHNFRTALDHLATAIVPGKATYFPIAPARKDFVTAPILSAMEQALPGAKSLLTDKIRPENGPNERLWSFNSLDRDDKHNSLLPVVTVAEITGFQIIQRGRVIDQGGRYRGDATQPINILMAYGPIAIRGDYETTVEVRFGQGSSFEGEPVVETLMSIGDLVTETLNEFECLIRG